MNKTLKKNIYIYKTLKNYKSSIRCFIPLSTRQIQGKIHFLTLSNNILFIDFGFKNEVELFTNELQLRIQNILSLKQRCNFIKFTSLIEFKIVVLDTFFFNKTLINKRKKTIDLKLFYFIFFLQQKKKNKQQKYYIKGRFLNFVKGGISIGLFGYVGFLPLSHALSKEFGKIFFFYILSIDSEKKIFVLSQAKIDTLLRKQLKLLRSRFFNIK